MVDLVYEVFINVVRVKVVILDLIISNFCLLNGNLWLDLSKLDILF